MGSAAAVLLTTGASSAKPVELENRAEAAWAAAQASGTLEAYANFLMMFPDSAQARIAYDKLSGGPAAGIGGSDARLLADDASDASRPGVLPGMIMIV
jgi:hypothetical protein